MSILQYLNNMKAGAPAKASTPKKQVDVFTDGSQIKDTKNKTYKTLGVGWAFIIKVDKVNIFQKSSGLKEGTNQRAELYAIFKALEYLTKNNIMDSTITIYTDSEYSIKCITKWAASWKRNGWKKAGTSTPVKHRELIEPSVDMVASLKDKNTIRFQHVRSHQATTNYISQGNDEADKLASAASKSMLTK